MDESKPHPDPKDYYEGPEAARRFQDAVRQIIAVPREEYEKWHTAWEEARKKQRKKAQRRKPHTFSCVLNKSG